MINCTKVVPEVSAHTKHSPINARLLIILIFCLCSTVSFTVGAAGVGEELAVASVRASGHDKNLPKYTLDNDRSTRWSAKGDGQWIEYDMGSPVLITRVLISFFKGDVRSAIFDVKASKDRKHWATIYSAQSSGSQLGLEKFDIADTVARYVRIVGHGNTANLWNSITEVDFYGNTGDGSGNIGGKDETGTDVASNKKKAHNCARPGSGVIYCHDFDKYPTGKYTDAKIKADWKTNFCASRNHVNVVSGRDALKGKSIRVTYPQGWGKKGRGAQWGSKLGKNYNEVYLSYWVMFNKGFNFVKGGKLPGLAGGKGNTGGRKPNGRDGWSARIMWRPKGEVVQYLYYPDQRSKWGDDVRWNVGHQRRFTPGKWHHVETRIKMNTPGKRNGIVQSWFDGELALDRRNIRFRDVASFSIDSLRFETFFGGGDASWGPKKNEYVYFDNVIVSTKRQGAR